MGRIQLSESQKWVIVAVLVGLLVSGGMLWGYVRGLEAGQAAREGTVGAAAVGPINLAAGVDCRSGSAACVIARNGRDLVMYSDSGSTEKFSVDGATGNVAVSTSKFTVAGASGNTVIAGTLNMSNQPISNVGAAGTDFSATGGLTLADGLTVSAGTVSLPSGSVTAVMIANPTRTVSIPLSAFVSCSGAGAMLDFTSGADTKPDFSVTDELVLDVWFDATGGSPDQDTPICTAFVVPHDYASDGEWHGWFTKSDHTGATELFAVCVSLDNFTTCGYGTTEITTVGGDPSVMNEVVVAPTPSVAYAAGKGGSVAIQIQSGTTMNDDVFLHALAFIYVASQ